MLRRCWPASRPRRRASRAAGLVALACLLPAAPGPTRAGTLPPPPAPRGATDDGVAAGPLDPAGDGRHLRALFLDLLGRTPLAEEIELARGASSGSLVRFLVGSEDFWRHVYESQLVHLLLIGNQRPGGGSDGPVLVERLHAGEIGLVEALHAIVAGPTFARANPGNDTFVSVVLEQMLGRTVQDEPALLAAGKRMYDGAEVSMLGARGDSQADLVTIVMAQDAMLEHLVAREYRRIVGTEPPDRVVREGAARLRADPLAHPDLVRGWVLGPEYAARLSRLRRKTDDQFLRGLWVDVARRRPTVEELQRQRDALEALGDATPLRAVLARVLIDEHAAGLPARGEVPPDELIPALFERFLGRAPGPSEHETFRIVYSQEPCQPRTLARALVTHWEYQFY